MAYRLVRYKDIVNSRKAVFGKYLAGGSKRKSCVKSEKINNRHLHYFIFVVKINMGE